MRYRVIKQTKTIEIWVSSDISSDAVEALIQRYKGKARSVIVYRSGHIDLVDATTSLLQSQGRKEVHL